MCGVLLLLPLPLVLALVLIVLLGNTPLNLAGLHGPFEFVLHCQPTTLTLDLDMGIGFRMQGNVYLVAVHVRK
jgi:hypothetical protein